MKNQPDKLPAYNESGFKSSIPDRPIDFLDEVMYLQKIKAQPEYDETVTYLIEDEDNKNRYIEVKTSISKMMERNECVQRLLAINHSPHRHRAKSIKIHRRAIYSAMQELGLSANHQDNVKFSLHFDGDAEFLPLGKFIDFCHHVCNLAIKDNDDQTFQTYQTLADHLRQKFSQRSSKNFFHLSQEDINKMKAQNINPSQADIKTIKKFLNQTDNDKNH